MRKLFYTCLLGIIASTVFQYQLFAQKDVPVTERNLINLLEQSSTSFSGQWFLTYQTGEINEEEFNRFFLQRGYITIKKSISKRLTGRITPDISVDQEGDGRGDIEMRLKYCYLKYSLPNFSFFSKPFIEFGLVHRPWLDFEEHINRYRVQGTMFLERNKIFNSADYGVTFISNFGGEMDKEYKNRTGSSHLGKYGSVAVGIYNGGGYHAIEENTNKTLEGRFTFRPFHQFLPGLMFSYHGIVGKGNTLQSPDWNLHAGFLSWEHKYYVLTAMYYNGDGNFKGKALDPSGRSLHQNGYSLFTELKLPKSNISFIGRYDFFDSNTNFDTGDSRRYILGAAYHFYKCKILLDYDVLNRNGLEDNDESVLELAVEVHY